MDEEYYRNGLWLRDSNTYALGNTQARREIETLPERDDGSFIDNFIDWIFGEDHAEFIVSTATTTTLLLLTTTIF